MTGRPELTASRTLITVLAAALAVLVVGVGVVALVRSSGSGSETPAVEVSPSAAGSGFSPDVLDRPAALRSRGRRGAGGDGAGVRFRGDQRRPAVPEQRCADHRLPGRLGRHGQRRVGRSVLGGVLGRQVATGPRRVDPPGDLPGRGDRQGCAGVDGAEAPDQLCTVRAAGPGGADAHTVARADVGGHALGRAPRHAHPDQFADPGPGRGRRGAGDEFAADQCRHVDVPADQRRHDVALVDR